MPNGKRLWRTASGALVEDGHPEAVRLAYGPDDELPLDEKGLELAKAAAVAPVAKQAPKPANKQAAKPADK